MFGRWRKGPFRGPIKAPYRATDAPPPSAQNLPAPPWVTLAVNKRRAVARSIVSRFRLGKPVPSTGVVIPPRPRNVELVLQAIERARRGTKPNGEIQLGGVFGRPTTRTKVGAPRVLDFASTARVRQKKITSNASFSRVFGRLTTRPKVQGPSVKSQAELLRTKSATFAGFIRPVRATAVAVVIRPRPVLVVKQTLARSGLRARLRFRVQLTQPFGFPTSRPVVRGPRIVSLDERAVRRRIRALFLHPTISQAVPPTAPWPRPVQIVKQALTRRGQDARFQTRTILGLGPREFGETAPVEISKPHGFYGVSYRRIKKEEPEDLELGIAALIRAQIEGTSKAVVSVSVKPEGLEEIVEIKVSGISKRNMDAIISAILASEL